MLRLRRFALSFQQTLGSHKQSMRRLPPPPRAWRPVNTNVLLKNWSAATYEVPAFAEMTKGAGLDAVGAFVGASR